MKSSRSLAPVRLLTLALLFAVAALLVASVPASAAPKACGCWCLSAAPTERCTDFNPIPYQIITCGQWAATYDTSFCWEPGPYSTGGDLLEELDAFEVEAPAKAPTEAEDISWSVGDLSKPCEASETSQTYTLAGVAPGQSACNQACRSYCQSQEGRIGQAWDFGPDACVCQCCF